MDWISMIAKTLTPFSGAKPFGIIEYRGNAGASGCTSTYVALPRSGWVSHSSNVDPAAHAGPAQGVLRRAVAARAAADHARRGQGRRTGRGRLDGDAAGPGDPPPAERAVFVLREVFDVDGKP